MADKILLRAGKKANMPTLADREPAYVTDENAIYVGTPSGNKKVGESVEKEIADMKTTLNGKLTASKVASMPTLEDTADIAAVISAYNSLITAMKASGVMES